MSDTPLQPAAVCKCGHVKGMHGSITSMCYDCTLCDNYVPVVAPDATADDDITALALSYIEMENTPPTRAQYNSVMSELFKASGECGDLRNELAALKGEQNPAVICGCAHCSSLKFARPSSSEKPSPDYTALIARGCEFLAKIDFLYEPGDNRKSWSDYRIIDDLTRALEVLLKDLQGEKA